ncbi:hypothetical protein MKK63_02185 [Methylobacterium sp. J-088]|uniref:hypothetical protein n=1 Tax=unclassified Methylobacterium TaxID=2615210 RepID=UPI001FB8AA5B|nr:MULTISPECIES: hypothetical protein [unclassified Methylobacterium]MCJ2061521.1 hypothetical protein [Methylobacterium sp. J-088]
MAKAPDPQPDHPTPDLEQVNDVLAQWTARSATSSPALIDRLEAMGYDVRDKSEDEIAEILHRPPTRPARQAPN